MEMDWISESDAMEIRHARVSPVRQEKDIVECQSHPQNTSVTQVSMPVTSLSGNGNALYQPSLFNIPIASMLYMVYHWVKEKKHMHWAPPCPL